MESEFNVMLNFAEFLVENLKVEKLTHLEHPEDHPLHAGAEGYKHAKDTLNAVHQHLQGNGDKNTKITTKYDGSNTVVFGHHPTSGKFFVGTKSTFSKKNPKINYNERDIDKNHGEIPHLAHTLKTALHHLPKVTPDKGVYQGDVMHTGVKKEGGKASFTPNTITYHASGEHADKAAKAKIGLVVHTQYKGKNLENMKADFNVNHDKFKKHPDVHHINPEVKSPHYQPGDKEGFQHHMQKAEEYHSRISPEGYNAVQKHSEHLKKHINANVRAGTTPSVESYKSSLTSPKHTEHVNANKESFHNALMVHHHLQQAKNHLVNSLGHSSEFKHSVNGKETAGEGFVATHNKMPSKLVNRAEFSRLNAEKHAKV